MYAANLDASASTTYTTIQDRDANVFMRFLLLSNDGDSIHSTRKDVDAEVRYVLGIPPKTTVSEPRPARHAFIVVFNKKSILEIDEYNRLSTRPHNVMVCT